MIKSIQVIFFVLCVFSANVFADFKQGGDEYKKGNYESAVEHFQKAAELNDHRAMYALGSMYAGGNGVEQDYKKAYVWFRKAEKYGRTDAQYKLGLMYEQGLGLKQNYKKAARWYHKAASVGYPPGQYKLGMMYANGTGLEQNPVKAYGWLTVALAYFKTGSSSETSAKGKEPVVEENKIDDPVKEMETTLNEITATLDSGQLQQGKELAEKIKRSKR